MGFKPRHHPGTTLRQAAQLSAPKPCPPGWPPGWLYRPITAQEFTALIPFLRGYVVGVWGTKDYEPNIPDENNPYAPGSQESTDWDAGINAGINFTTFARRC